MVGVAVVAVARVDVGFKGGSLVVGVKLATVEGTAVGGSFANFDQGVAFKSHRLLMLTNLRVGRGCNRSSMVKLLLLPEPGELSQHVPPHARFLRLVSEAIKNVIF